MSQRPLALAIALSVSSVLVFSSAALAGGLPREVNGKHVMWGAGQGYPSTNQASANNLIYHGGPVEVNPAVYIVYWGPAWQNGFNVSQGGFNYTSTAVQNYISTFFNTLGGSSWAGMQTQYCDGIMAPAFSCTGQAGAHMITNPGGQLKGTWVDPSPVPQDILATGLATNLTTDPIEAEALKAAAHFGYVADATYFVLSEPGHSATAYGTVYCAYHSQTNPTTSPSVYYAFLPYVPEQGGGCGMNSVNATDDAFGHGYLDGYSIVGGHEYAEAVTDPGNLSGVQNGWNDATTSENGDKCAWTGLQNLTLGSQYFAVQPLWSNRANGGQGACAMS